MAFFAGINPPDTEQTSVSNNPKKRFFPAQFRWLHGGILRPMYRGLLQRFF